MVNLQGKRIYLGTLEKDHCKILREEFEYDFSNMTEELDIGQSIEKSDEWHETIKEQQGKTHIWLGIFLNNGKIIGDIGLHDLDFKNRVCILGMEITKIENRNKGYGKEAVTLLLEYAFNNIGFEKIISDTLETNKSAQRSLEQIGFVLEGKERKARYFAGTRYDRYHYGLLREEYNNRDNIS
jgi:RimJ/RimL family protein N-acetyltransferase